MEPGSAYSLRPWRRGDVDALTRFANNRNIWINLRDRFPHPYTRADAEAWIVSCESHAGNSMHFAIDVGNQAIGGVGIELLDDVHRRTAEIGYWLAEPYWGRGFATAAVIETTRYAFAELPIDRMQALVFEWNPASARVLEKAGYLFEARLRRFIFKDGRVGDGILYARLSDLAG
jgi:RimJ/RimL family protein N-acetyltransferase